MSTSKQHHLNLSKDKKFLGLFGGIAEYFGLDHNLIRLIGLILIVLTGIIPGLIIYLIAAAIVKSEK
jgi:phage shock protein C